MNIGVYSMSFFEAGTKYLNIIKSYSELSESDKIEANHLLLAYEELMKQDADRLSKAELPLLLDFTQSGQAILLKDIALADKIFRRTIDLTGGDKKVMFNYSEFLNIHGWDLESLQLKIYIQEKDLKNAVRFINGLDTFEGDEQINLSREPSALVAFAKGEEVSAFSYIGKRYLEYLKHNLYGKSTKHKDTLQWLDEKMRLYIPCISEKDLVVLHQFTLKGWAKYVDHHDIIFKLYEKNFELEPESDFLQNEFCQLLSHRKMHDILYNEYNC